MDRRPERLRLREKRHALAPCPCLMPVPHFPLLPFPGHDRGRLQFQTRQPGRSRVFARDSEALTPAPHYPSTAPAHRNSGRPDGKTRWHLRRHQNRPVGIVFGNTFARAAQIGAFRPMLPLLGTPKVYARPVHALCTPGATRICVPLPGLCAMHKKGGQVFQATQGP